MSKYIATRAVRGANALVYEAETMLHTALAEKGPETVVEFPNTAIATLAATYSLIVPLGVLLIGISIGIRRRQA